MKKLKTRSKNPYQHNAAHSFEEGSTKTECVFCFAAIKSALLRTNK